MAKYDIHSIESLKKKLDSMKESMKKYPEYSKFNSADYFSPKTTIGKYLKSLTSDINGFFHLYKRRLVSRIKHIRGKQ